MDKEKNNNATQSERKSGGFLTWLKTLPKRWFIDAFSGMAQGLFVTLIAGTIIKTLGQKVVGNNVVGNFMVLMGSVAALLTGAGIGVGMAHSLKADKLVMFSAAVAGFAGAYAEKLLGTSFTGGTLAELAPLLAKGNPGNPVSAYVCSLLAIEVGSVVSGKTKLDILLVPLTCLVCAAIGLYASYPFILLIRLLGDGIKTATEITPFFMGIIIAVVMGVLLTMPTSSAAIWVSIVGAYGAEVPSAVLLAGGAAVVGCSCQMIGFAVMSFRENGWGGLVSQGLGTSMLQIPNIMKKPVLILPPIIASAILGPVATCVFRLYCDASGGGMGTSGLVGVFGTVAASSGAIPAWQMWVGIVLLMFVIPAALCLGMSEFMRKKGIIKPGDLKI